MERSDTLSLTGDEIPPHSSSKRRSGPIDEIDLVDHKVTVAAKAPPKKVTSLSPPLPFFPMRVEFWWQSVKENVNSELSDTFSYRQSTTDMIRIAFEKIKVKNKACCKKIVATVVS